MDCVRQTLFIPVILYAGAAFCVAHDLVPQWPERRQFRGTRPPVDQTVGWHREHADQTYLVVLAALG
jgi:hypothetical protein